MQRFVTGLLLPLIIAAAFTACNSGGRFQPFAAPGARMKPDFGLCAVPIVNAPGIYPYFWMAGTIKAGEFVVNKGEAHWQRLAIGSSSQSPAWKPKTAQQPLYLYVGRYSLRKNGQGCIDLYESKIRGARIVLGSGYPQTLMTSAARGPVLDARISIGGFYKSFDGAKGTVVLFNKNGARWDSGTITISHRIPMTGS